MEDGFRRHDDSTSKMVALIVYILLLAVTLLLLFLCFWHFSADGREMAARDWRQRKSLSVSISNFIDRSNEKMRKSSMKSRGVSHADEEKTANDDMIPKKKRVSISDIDIVYRTASESLATLDTDAVDLPQAQPRANEPRRSEVDGASAEDPRHHPSILSSSGKDDEARQQLVVKLRHTSHSTSTETRATADETQTNEEDVIADATQTNISKHSI